MECHLLWHFIMSYYSYIVYVSIIISMSTIVICSYMSFWKASATSQLKHAAHLRMCPQKTKLLDDRKNFQFKKGE